MPSFSINIQQTQSSSGRLGEHAQKLQSYTSRIDSVLASGVGGQTASMQIAFRGLRALYDDANAHSTYLYSMQSVLDQSRAAYQMADRKAAGLRLPGHSLGNVIKGSGGSAGAVISSNKNSLWGWKDTWKAVGQFGFVGTSIAAIGGVITDSRDKALLNGLKGGSSIIGSAAGLVDKLDKNKFSWRDLLGMAPKPKTAKSFGDALGEEINKYNFGKATTVSGKVEVGAKWAGSIFTVAASAYDNYKENKGDTKRIIAETVGESTVKIVGNTLIKAGVTALLSATGAPAVVTGLAAVGVVWGINAISKAMTGKGAAELISDAVIDYAPKILKSVGKGIGKGVSTVGKKISGWWNKATPALNGSW